MNLYYNVFSIHDLLFKAVSNIHSSTISIHLNIHLFLSVQLILIQFNSSQFNSIVLVNVVIGLGIVSGVLFIMLVAMFVQQCMAKAKKDNQYFQNFDSDDGSNDNLLSV